jgi:hypothetical protein
MEFVKGRIITDTDMAELSPDDRRKAYDLSSYFEPKIIAKHIGTDGSLPLRLLLGFTH